MRRSIAQGEPLQDLARMPLTLQEALQQVGQNTDHKGLVHVRGTGEEEFQSYADLLTAAEQVLGGLRARGLTPGTPVMVEVQDPAHLLAVFWGCLLGGYVPAPLQVPASFDWDANEMAKTRNVHRLLGQPLLVTDALYVDKFAVLPDIQVVAAEALLQHAPDAHHHTAHPDDLAFLQFSSGSTGLPKGVQLTHDNLRHNIAALIQRLQLDSDDVFVNWMPYYHDMGLIMFHLVPTFLGAQQVKLTHETFVRRPELFLRTITAHRGTIAGAPNFGLDWMLQKVRVGADLDLSSLRRLLNGAEPIAVETAEAFVDRFASAGLRPEAMSYVYGMAEACVGVSIPIADPMRTHTSDLDLFVKKGVVQTPATLATPHLRLADEGEPLPGMTVRVVNEADEIVPEGQVGHVQIQGPNVTAGYYQLPDVNETLFCAGFLRTGDLGLLQDGRLVITGRQKDVLFQNGQNFYAHDVEELVQRKLELPHQSVAVVGTTAVTNGREVVVLFLKSKKKADDLLPTVRAIKRVAAEHMGVELAGVVPLPALPKTSSGKLERYKLRQRLQAGEFDRLLSAQQARTHGEELVMPRNATERRVQQIWAKALQVPTSMLGIHIPFSELAGSSLKEMELLWELEEWVGKGHVPFTLLADCPTIEAMAQYVEGLALEPLHTAAVTTQEAAALPRVEPREVYEASVGQRALLFLERMTPGMLAYHEHYRLLLRGPLKVVALQRAIAAVMARHGALRTVYEVRDGDLVQRVRDAESDTVDLPFRDLSWCAPKEQVARLEQLLLAELRTPFDFENGPLVRWSLMQLGEDVHCLQLVAHHSIIDVTSFSLVYAELSELYEAEVEQRKPELAPPSHYVDFATWQQTWRGGEEFEQSMQYWLEQLAHPLPMLEVPTDRPRQTIQTFNGRTLHLPLAPALSDQVRQFGHVQGASVFMVLLAAYAIWLRSRTGQDDLLIGVPLAARTEQTQSIVGYFANTMPVRLQMADVESFEQVVEQVRGQVYGMLAHQTLPFPLLVERLNPERDPSRPVLFSTLFNMPTAPDLTWSGFDVELLDSRKITCIVDLAWIVLDLDSHLHLSVEYNTDLYEERTVRRFMASYQQVLSACLTEASRPMDDLPLLTAEEQTLYQQLNETQTAPVTQSIAEVFTGVVATCGARVAVSDGRTSVTYSELDQQAEQIAQHLRARGVGRQQLVGLLMERSVSFVVALLGVLKAGAAYLPIDPDYPTERVQHLLTDSAADVVLINQTLLGEKDEVAAPLLVFEDLATTAVTAARPISTVQPDDLAYVIYTSGSTGKPKGVQVKQAGVVNLARWKREAFGFGADDVVVQFASFSFDASVWELFGALLNGAHLHLLAADARWSADAFAHAVSAVGATRATLPNGFFHHVALETPQPQRLATLRTVFVAGEALHSHVVQAWRGHIGEHVEVVNAYGPTEATVCGTVYRVPAYLRAGAVPIGRPIANVEAYVLNAERRLSPLQTVGELYLGGIGLAQGYLQRPEQTAAAFVPHPFRAGERLYRTGDLVKLRPDGQLEFVGRADDQVKVRGHRVELGEIEAVMLQHPLVTAAAVIIERAVDRSALLHAFHVGGDLESLRSHMEAYLPAHMVPARVTELAQMPLSPTGKVDRPALQALAASSMPQPVAVWEAPQTTMERLVASIWQDILQLEGIGRRDDFFAKGGHSLLLMRMQTRLQERLGVVVEMKELFDRPKLIDMAAYIAQVPGRMRVQQAMQIPRLPAQADYALSFAQRRLWFLQQLAPHSTAYHVHSQRLHQGSLDVARFQAAVQAVVARHAALRTVFVSVDGEPRQQVVAEMQVPVEVVVGDLTTLRAAIRQLDADPFDLTQGPLVRVVLGQLGDDQYLLHVIMHHIVTDGWSLEVFFQELWTCYTGELQLPETEVRYVDYAAWQAVSDEEEAYWLQQLASLPVLDFPTDKPRPEVMTHNGDLLLRTIASEQWSDVQAVARQEEVSPFMLLFTAYVWMLQRVTQSDDLAVGTPTAGRTAEALEPLIGFFVNTLVLRIRFGELRTVRDLLQAVKQQCLAALSHQSYPFDLLVEKLNPVRDTSRAPLLATMFAYQQEDRAGQFGERTTAATVHQTSKVDLSLLIVDDTFAWEYNTDLFLPETVERWATMYETALTTLLRDREQLLQEVDLLSAADRALHEHLHLPAEERVYDTLAQRVETMAARWSERVAVRDDQTALTYHELNERANRLAHGLRAQGVGAHHVVALAGEREVALTVALLAVWKAGAGFTVLHPQDPPARTQHVLNDCAAVGVLAVNEAAAEKLRDATAGLSLWCLTEQELTTTSSDNPVHTQDATDLACVLYTSGSTGRPKGAWMRHAGFVNFAEWLGDAFGYHEQDVVLSVAATSFDAFVGDVCGSWLHGGTLQLLSEAERLSPARLAEAVVRYGGTRAFLPTALYHLITATLQAEEVSHWAGMRTLFVGGERLSTQAVRTWQAQVGLQVQVVHVYGPTEATVFSTYHPIDGPVPAELAQLPIGRPLPNYQAYVLDPQMLPCPVQVPGTLYIGGVGLAKEYVRLPERTASAFIEHPRYGRLYDTGDRVRLLPSGELEYVARRDNQVKVRGHRVELGEVETALRQHPHVHAAAVVDITAPDGNHLLVGFYVTPEALPPGELEAVLREQVPLFMMPSRLHRVDELPLSVTGKLDRRTLREWAVREQTVAVGAQEVGAVQQRIAAIWADVLGQAPAQIGLDQSFFEIGGHSLLLHQVHVRLVAELGADCSLVELFQFPTVRTLAARLAQPAAAEAPAPQIVPVREQEAVAVIGIGLRYPDAETAGAFWDNIRTGHRSIRDFPLSELEGTQPWADPSRLVRVGAHLRDIDQFDPGFFGISEREAELMDPQHRLFLECVWEAVEDAGYNVHAIEGRVALYAGVSPNDYLPRHTPFATQSDQMQALMMSQPSFLATRISYLLNLQGESLMLDTACSTSLVAVHHACKELLGGRADYALAGGVAINVPHKSGYLYEPGNIMSPDGHCYSFDHRASGTAAGNGAGVVLLKRLSDARRDGDPIYAVIAGTATNNDGHLKIGYTAPSQRGQAEVIRAAQQVAGVEPAQIGYVETHGSGTPLGDLIEHAALREVFGTREEEAQPHCALGAVKAAIGHTNAASGVAGLIKTVLAVHHGEIPPLVNFSAPNPELDVIGSPFYFPTEAKSWATDHPLRRAGVSSFGIGGTNAHAIIEQFPASPRLVKQDRDCHLFTLAARSETAVRTMAARLAAHLEQVPDVDLGDLAYTLHVGRVHHAYRLPLVAADATELRQLCQQVAAGAFICTQQQEHVQVSLHVTATAGEGADSSALYTTSRPFRHAVDHCLQVLAAPDRNPVAHAFAEAYALASLWRSWGLHPTASSGDGIGYWVAAHLNGHLSLEQALQAAIEQTPPPSREAAVASRDDYRIVLGPPTWAALHQQLGHLWAVGAAIDWSAYDADFERKRVHAPTYPFERRSYWVQVARQPEHHPTPAPAPTAQQMGRSTAAILRDFWQEVTGTEDIAATDHFFEIGGGSLNLIQVQSRINKEWGLNVQMADLFHFLTLEEQAAYVDALRGAEQELPRAEPVQQLPTTTIPRAPQQAHYPLAHPQRYMWKLQALDPTSPAYLTYNNFTLDGPLDVDVFRAAYDSLFARHASLRTTFLLVDGEPRQQVHPAVDTHFSYEDWSASPTGIPTRIQADRDRPFDLEKGPLAWALLLQETPDRHHFQYTQHHLITDGWSLNLFMTELMETYEALVRGTSPTLAPLRVEFLDYALWNVGEGLVEEEDYWLQMLSGPLPTLDLPTDRPRAAQQTFAGTSYAFDVPADVVRQAWRSAMRDDVSRVMVVFAAYVMLLQRLTDTDDVIIGLPVAGRTLAELEPVIGCFANMVPIRLRLAGVQTPSDLLQLVKQQMLAGIEHQAYPMDRLIEKLGLDWSAQRVPLLATFFNFGALHEQAGREHGGIRVGAPAYEWNITTAKLDLNAHVMDLTDEHLRLSFEYNTDLFDAETLQQFATLYIECLRAVGEQLRRPLSTVTL